MTPQVLTADLCEEVLAAVRKSKSLGKSQRQENLLAYLLQESLSGDSQNVKEYSIAVDVFNRSESFKSSVDSIVRVEMHRLRKNIIAFNNSQNIFKVILEPRSYEIRLETLVNTHKEETNYTKTPLWSILILGALLATVIGASIFFRMKDQSPENNLAIKINLPPCQEMKTDFRPQVFVKSNSVEIAAEALKVLSQYSLLQPILLNNHSLNCLGNPSYLIDINELSGEALSTQIYSIEDNGLNLSSIEVFRASEDDPEVDFDLRLARLGYFVGHQDGILPKLAISKNWANDDAKGRYKCILDTHAKLSGSASSVSHSDNINCLLRETNKKTQNADIYALLAAYRQFQYLGYLDSEMTKQELEVQIAKNLEKSVMYGPNNTETIISAIRNEKIKAQYSELALREFTRTIELRAPFEPHLSHQSAVVLSYVFAEHEKAKKTSDVYRAIKGDSFHRNQILYLISIIEDDFDEQSYFLNYFSRLGDQSLPYISTLNLAASINNNDAKGCSLAFSDLKTRNFEKIRSTIEKTYLNIEIRMKLLNILSKPKPQACGFIN